MDFSEQDQEALAGLLQILANSLGMFGILMFIILLYMYYFGGRRGT